MGYTNREYTTWEISILTEEYADHDNERCCVGDIIAVRRPHNIIGTKEAYNMIWLRVDGLEMGEYSAFKYPELGYDYDFKIDHLPKVGTDPSNRFDKKRYCVPLRRLKKVIPSFNINRAKDLEDLYQPFITMDFSTSNYWYYLAPETPLSVYGLVYDKTIGDYL